MGKASITTTVFVALLLLTGCMPNPQPSNLELGQEWIMIATVEDIEETSVRYSDYPLTTLYLKQNWATKIQLYILPQPKLEESIIKTLEIGKRYKFTMVYKEIPVVGENNTVIGYLTTWDIEQVEEIT